MKNRHTGFIRSFAVALVGLLTFPVLVADQANAALATHVTAQVNEILHAFPKMHVLLVTGDADRPVEQQRIRHYLHDYQVSYDVLAEDDELAQIFKDNHSQMEPANWVLNDDPNNTVCLITLDRRDYSQASGSYWKQSWDVREKDLNLSLDPVQVGNWNIDHELYHCITAHLKLHPQPQLPHGMLEQLYYESSADVFAALKHLQATNDRSLIQTTAAVRQVYIGEDTEHFSTLALQYIVDHPAYSQASLRHLTPLQLARLSYQIINYVWPSLAREAQNAVGDERTGMQMNKVAYRRLKHMESRQKLRGF